MKLNLTKMYRNIKVTLPLKNQLSKPQEGGGPVIKALMEIDRPVITACIGM
jgi:hypothetical protein